MKVMIRGEWKTVMGQSICVLRLASLDRCPKCGTPLEWRGGLLICPRPGCEGAEVEA